jgi:NAD(P)-dependent dehydrogenase (short-subunit alcohol dehydrogenase family)
MGQLDGKRAIVTGAGRSIGRAIALAFVREGANVLACARTAETLAETAALADGDGEIEVMTADVAIAADVNRMVATASERFGPITTLVNNAGVLVPGTVLDTSLEDYEQMMAVNVRGVFLTCRAVLPIMIAGGGGSIINIASINSVVAESQLAVYTTTKGAVLMLSKAVALDHATDGVRCNAVCPGFVDTPLNEPHYNRLGGREALEAGLPSFQPIGRAIREEEIADPVVFLASDASSAMTGTTFLVDGGVTAKA